MELFKIEPIKGLKNTGLSLNCLNLPSGFVQVAMFKSNHISTQAHSLEIENKIRKERINLNNIKCDVTFGAPIFSYFITQHQNIAISRREVKVIELKYGKGTEFLKFLKTRETHKIAAVDKAFEDFYSNLNPERHITVNGKSFAIFSILEVDTVAKTVSFRFSKEFMEYLNKDKNPLTYIQIEDLKTIKSNRTSATLFMMDQSVSGLDKERYRTRKYIALCLGFFGNNSNQKIDSAFASLEEKGLVKVKKKIKATKVGNKVYFWALYVFDKVKTTFQKAKKLTKKQKKEQRQTVDVDKSFFTTKRVDGYKPISVELFANIIS